MIYSIISTVIAVIDTILIGVLYTTSAPNIDKVLATLTGIIVWVNAIAMWMTEVGI
jgi:hypothetical protein